MSDTDWNQIFQEIDSGGSGSVEWQEMFEYLKKRFPNISKTAVQSALKSLDVDQDGKVTKSEFVEVMSRKSINDPNEMRKAFEKFDTDKSGFITKDELARAMKSMGMDSSSEDIEQIIKSVSKDDDKIDYKEFEAAMR